MGSITRILIAVDFSPCSVAALRYAAFLGEHSGAALHVLHVVDATLAVATAGQVADCQKRLNALVTQVCPSRLRRPEVEIVVGQTASAILEAAQTMHPDLIVMGKYGDGKAEMSPSGNVLRAVSALSPCGVVPVHPAADQRGFFALSAIAANDGAATDVQTVALCGRVVPFTSLSRLPSLRRHELHPYKTSSPDLSPPNRQPKQARPNPRLPH